MPNAQIKINLQEILQSERPVILELGCGRRKQAGRIGVDTLDLPGVDIVADLNQGLSFLPDHSVDEIHSTSLLEHLADLPAFLREILRVLKPTGKNYAYVPHFSNPYYYSDYTHTRFFGLYTFYYFVEPEDQLRRKVPHFYTDIRLRVHSVRYVFSSPFRERDIFKRWFGVLFNGTTYMKEFYEEHFCYLVPCDGMEIVIGPP